MFKLSGSILGNLVQFIAASLELIDPANLERTIRLNDRQPAITVEAKRLVAELGLGEKRHWRVVGITERPVGEGTAKDGCQPLP
jgi:hypothetical protein